MDFIIFYIYNVLFGWVDEYLFDWVYEYDTDALISAIGTIIIVLLGLNFSGKFKTAIEELIEANPTSISNPVVFSVFGVLLFVVVGAWTLVVFADYIGAFEYEKPGFWILTTPLGIVLYAMVGFSIAGLYFQPERANVKIDKSSSVAEDAIALASFTLKVPLCFAAMLSNTLIILGVLTILSGLGDWFEGGYIGSDMVKEGLAYFTLGAVAPFLFYLTFLIFFPIYSYLLAILHIPKIGQK
tara:strand:+ start:2836 stop:3558 length:723 start_codon:yes stop_codon:yes gene_type:complete